MPKKSCKKNFVFMFKGDFLWLHIIVNKKESREKHGEGVNYGR